MATPLICLKISPENVKQLSVKTSSAKRSSVSVEGSLTVRWSKKYLSAKSPSLFGITVYREVMSMVERNLLLPGKLNSFPNVAILTASCLKHSIVSKTSIENPL